MTTMDRPLEGEWALILGASSGFGRAVALELAGLGMNVAGVHLDRKSTLPNVERLVGDIRSLGREALFFNVNAADAEKRRDVLKALHPVFQKPGGPHDDSRAAPFPCLWHVEAIYLRTSRRRGQSISDRYDARRDGEQPGVLGARVIGRGLAGSGWKNFCNDQCRRRTRVGDLWCRVCREGRLGVSYSSTHPGISPDGHYRKRDHGRRHRYSRLTENSRIRRDACLGPTKESLGPINHAQRRG